AYDLGFLLKWDGEPDGDFILLGDVSLVVFARPSHVLVKHVSVHAIPRAALAEFRVFVTDRTGDFRAALLRFFAADRVGAPIIESSGSVEGVKRAVIADASALGLLPAFAVAEELRLGSIVRLPIRPALPGMQLAAALSRRRPPHPAVEALVEILR